MKQKMPAPLCRRCGSNHYNVITCAKHAAQTEYEESKRVFVRWRSDGPRPFGDDLPSFNRAGNTFWRKHEQK